MTTTALITGGTSGIGRAVANKLAELGVHVVVVGRNVKRGETAIAEIRTAGGQADFISSDLRDASSAREVARRAIELGNGQIDILINNAGIYPFGLTHETSEELFDKVYSLNVKVPYFLVAADVPLFVEHCEAVAAEIDVKLRWLGEQARRGRSVWSGALPGRHVMLEVACEPSVVGSL